LLKLLRTSDSPRTIEHIVEALASYETNDEVTSVLVKVGSKDNLAPDLRLAIAQELLRRGEREGVRILIQTLSAGGPPLAMNRVAQQLRTATGKSFDFDPMSSSKAKQKAIQKWQEFWKQQREDLQ